MKTKQQRKAEKWEEYRKIDDSAWKEYYKKCEEIDDEDKKVCPKCKQEIKE